MELWVILIFFSTLYPDSSETFTTLVKPELALSNSRLLVAGVYGRPFDHSQLVATGRTYW